MSRRTLVFPVAIMLLCASLAGCSTIDRMFGHKPEQTAEAERLRQLQLLTMRYADDYVGRIVEPLNEFQLETRSPEKRLYSQSWEISQATSAFTIASGPNPTTNVLDMVVLATLSRMVLDDSWAGVAFGTKVTAMRQTQRALEPQAWALLDGVLTPDDAATLRELITAWRAENPAVHDVAYIRFSDFADSSGQGGAAAAGRSASLFALLGLDPFSNLDPAVVELTQTRQLAERTIYYLQRTPTLVDMQAERFIDQLAVMPETGDLLAAVARTSVAAEKTGVLAAELPNVLSRERQAAIEQVMQALDIQQGTATRLLVEMRATLDAGTATASSLDQAVKSFSTLMSRFDRPVGAPGGGATGTPSVPGKPFNINEYTNAAREFAEAARQLQVLVASLDQDSGKLMVVADRASEQLRDSTDYMFRRAATLLLIFLAGLLMVGMIYRTFAHWLARSPRPT